MLKKIKELSITLAASLLLAVPVLAPVSVHAADPEAPADAAAASTSTIRDNLCNGVSVANGEDKNPGDANTSCVDGTDSDTNVNGIIKFVINMFSLIVGAVSIIMIIYGGFKYITSGGNDSNVGSAKNTILYALIGLIIVALAQVIVRFVLSKAVTAAA